jgi:hypothetical protein
LKAWDNSTGKVRHKGNPEGDVCNISRGNKIQGAFKEWQLAHLGRIRRQEVRGQKVGKEG